MILTDEDAVQIGQIGEQYVVQYLEDHGHPVTKHDTKSPGKTDIETDTELVQVKTSLYPNEPKEPSSTDLGFLKSRATKLDRKPLVALVIIDTDGSLLNLGLFDTNASPVDLSLFD